MNILQQTLAIAIAKRDAAKATLERFRQSVASLAQAEQTASKGESDARALLENATMAKVRGDGDTTANARAVYHTAMADLAVAETEHAAGKRVVAEAEHELEQLTKASHRAAVDVAKAIAAAEEPALILAARRYGNALARHKSLIRFARAASADAGTVSDPIADLNSNNPLKLQLDALTNPQVIDSSFAVTEASLLDAKVTIGTGAGIGGRIVE